MQMQISPRVKICCIQNKDEAMLAIRSGASALGLVSAMPSGPGPIPEELIAEIVKVVPPPVATFLLTSERKAEVIIAQHKKTKTNTLQLVDAVPFEDLKILRRELPGVKLVQVIHVLGSQSLDEARSAEPFVDALLLDSGNPALPVKELGGTGRVHNWEISASIVSTVGIPVYLAGGLTHGNVADAIGKVRPFAVDVCSGVRTSGALDNSKLLKFMQAVQRT